nr:hypothetical protein [Robinsoniella peoriensis]
MMADAREYTFLVHLPNFIYTFICSDEINQITGGAAGYPDDFPFSKALSTALRMVSLL